MKTFVRRACVRACVLATQTWEMGSRSTIDMGVYFSTLFIIPFSSSLLGVYGGLCKIMILIGVVHDEQRCPWCHRGVAREQRCP